MSKFKGNAITWFEIPTSDFARATSFYESVLDVQLASYPGSEPCKMFPVEPGDVGGCLVLREGLAPTSNGPLVYLNAEGKLDATLKRAEKAGVQVLTPRTEIPGGFGYYAHIIDSEGNRVGLHSSQF